jgi:hypothetical protein
VVPLPTGSVPGRVDGLGPAGGNATASSTEENTAGHDGPLRQYRHGAYVPSVRAATRYMTAAMRVQADA